MQAQLYQSQKLQALGTLAGGIAHEFNNMIAAIIGNASLAIQDVGSNQAARESLDQITAAAERARALTRRILLFGRAQPDTRKSTALAPVVEDVMRLLRATLPARITLSLAQNTNLPTVRADATQLHQLIVNLCTNAAHAIGNEAGSIEISLSVSPSAPAAFHARRRRIRVYQRHGHGLRHRSAGARSYLRAFLHDQAVGEGAGLGLSVVHSIVQGHEGAIEVESTPEHGSTFRVYLPAETAADAPAARTESAPDDSPQRLLRDVHRRRSHHRLGHGAPAHAPRLPRRGIHEPRKALERLRTAPEAPSLLVSDYNMAEMSGLDVAKHAAEIHPDMPVVIVSGFIDERVERTGPRVGRARVRAQAGSAGNVRGYRSAVRPDRTGLSGSNCPGGSSS